MTSVIFMLMLQFVVSTKAGHVNHVQGEANVKAMQSVPMGAPIKTGPNGFAEILLNPGSYLRLGQNSEAVLDGIELVDVSVRLLSGTAVIEAVGFDKATALKVATGDLKIRIIKDGVYAFKDGYVRVVEGQLQIEGNKTTYKKGWEYSGLGARKVPQVDRMNVELWSRNRSNLIARANVTLANTYRRNPSIGASWSDVWLFDPSFGGFTFMPGRGFRSPYGYGYRSMVEAYNRSVERSVSYGGGSSNSAADASRSGSGSSSGSNSNSGSNSGGAGIGPSSGGSFGAPAPAAPPPPAASPRANESNAATTTIPN